MTEVPEHLLRRSRERREALGLAPPSGEAPAAEADSGTQGMSTATPEAPATAAAAAEPQPDKAQPATPAPAAPTGVESAGPAALVPAPSPAAQAVARTRVPIWVMPVLVILPFWGIFYVGAFGDRTVKKVLTPQEVYAKGGCSSCHGAQGEGGTGPPLSGGQSKLTFLTEEEHVNWVKQGSAPVTGQKYGNPARPGGQQGPATGGMPGFSGQLTEEEIRLVVKYERDQL